MLALAVSCAKQESMLNNVQEISPSAQNLFVLTAIGGENEAKAEIDGTTGKFTWNTTDRIAVHTTDGYKLSSTASVEEEDPGKATFLVDKGESSMDGFALYLWWLVQMQDILKAAPNKANSTYPSANEITIEIYNHLIAEGAIFIPACGLVSSITTPSLKTGAHGGSWTSTESETNAARANLMLLSIGSFSGNTGVAKTSFKKYPERVIANREA